MEPNYNVLFIFVPFVLAEIVVLIRYFVQRKRTVSVETVVVAKAEKEAWWNRNHVSLVSIRRENGEIAKDIPSPVFFNLGDKTEICVFKNGKFELMWWRTDRLIVISVLSAVNLIPLLIPLLDLYIKYKNN